MLNNVKIIENKDYAGLKKDLISLFNIVLEDNKKINLADIDNLRKMAALNPSSKGRELYKKRSLPLAYRPEEGLRDLDNVH